MSGRRIIAVFFMAVGIALAAWALLGATGAIDRAALVGGLFPGLAEGPPVMFLVLGAAAAAFGLAVFLATFRRRE